MEMVAVIYHSREWERYVSSGFITHTVGEVTEAGHRIALMVWNGRYIN